MASIKQLGLNPVQRQSLVISLTAFFTGLLVIALISVLALISIRGGAYFWPQPIYAVSYSQGGITHKVLAQRYLSDETERVFQLNYSDFHHPYGTQALVKESDIVAESLAIESAQIKLTDGRNLLATPMFLRTPTGDKESLDEYADVKRTVNQINNEIYRISSEQLADIHNALAALDAKDVALDAPAREKLVAQFHRVQEKVIELEGQLSEYLLALTFSGSQTLFIKVSDIATVTYVSQLNYVEKWQVVVQNLITFLTESPKQANTSGGVFPALFGTILMVFLMTIIVTPFGVLAAIYLSEYAPDNGFTTAIRISVSNMAGVPSIVYGVFGLGFFVYSVGGSIDALSFSDSLPAPTMGTPGVFWAALTMAILTLPVVIVATEEGLRRVPEGLKAGSYALGATKIETIMKTILPIASPGIMTGVILAIARAAGEVAPLMLVGAVKFAPNLPFDGEFPYLHLDRQFMHLGVLIYDGAFHSQTDAKSASMMFAACLLLLVVVFVLNVLAVILRTRLRKRYLQG